MYKEKEIHYSKMKATDVFDLISEEDLIDLAQNQPEVLMQLCNITAIGIEDENQQLLSTEVKEEKFEPKQLKLF